MNLIAIRHALEITAAILFICGLIFVAVKQQQPTNDNSKLLARLDKASGTAFRNLPEDNTAQETSHYVAQNIHEILAEQAKSKANTELPASNTINTMYSNLSDLELKRLWARALEKPGTPFQ